MMVFLFGGIGDEMEIESAAATKKPAAPPFCTQDYSTTRDLRSSLTKGQVEPIQIQTRLKVVCTKTPHMTISNMEQDITSKLQGY